MQVAPGEDGECGGEDEEDGEHISGLGGEP